MTDNYELIAEAITEYWGERCPDYAEGCYCCEAWKEYDHLRTLLESNAALERERTNLIETKREQIGRLQKERDEQWKRADTIAQQNAYHKDRAETAEAAALARTDNLHIRAMVKCIYAQVKNPGDRFILKDFSPIQLQTILSFIESFDIPAEQLKD